MTDLLTKMSLAGGPCGPQVTESPTNRLMLAVLEEALVTFRKGLRSHDPRKRRSSLDVDLWVASNDQDLVFSFESICSSLELDSAYVREGLRGIRAAAERGQVIPQLRAPRREQMVGRRAWRGRIVANKPSLAR